MTRRQLLAGVVHRAATVVHADELHLEAAEKLVGDEVESHHFAAVQEVVDVVELLHTRAVAERVSQLAHLLPSSSPHRNSATRVVAAAVARGKASPSSDVLVLQTPTWHAMPLLAVVDAHGLAEVVHVVDLLHAACGCRQQVVHVVDILHAACGRRLAVEAYRSVVVELQKLVAAA